MPKQVWKIERFDGGLNNANDPRDISDNELNAATGISVNKKGRIITAGRFVSHDAPDVIGSSITSEGYGMFAFSHDRTLAHNGTEAELTGQHTGSDHATIMTDSNGTFTTDELIGSTIKNDTDGSSGVITDNDGTTITVSALAGGSDNSWDNADDDYYRVIPAETGDNYLITSSGGTGAAFKVYSFNTDVHSANIIDLGTGTTAVKPAFFVADGGLRVSDGNFGADCKNKWFGYIERVDFSTAAIASSKGLGTFAGWYSKDIDLAKPTVGVYGLTSFTDTHYASTPAGNVEYSSTDKEPSSDPFRFWTNINGKHIVISTDGSNQARMTDGNGDEDRIPTVDNSESGNWNGEAIRVFPNVGAGWNVYFQPSSRDGNWESEYYKIGTTFIYQNEQESNILDIDKHGNYFYTAGGLQMTAGKAIDVKIHATAPYDPFIIGGRVYIKKARIPDDWVLLADISLVSGVRKDLTSEYTAWTVQDATGSGDAPSNRYCYVDMDPIENPSPWTYRAINGYKSDESVSLGGTSEGWKTAVVANRQVYVGNVNRTNDDGIITHEGDAMYKSMPGKFDTFPVSRKIIASVQDGDEIIKLEEYADRILQFKKKKMHLINVSQDVEFLEDTFLHKGVDQPGSVCKTDFGIAWVNKHGVYLYNGQSVVNLLEKNGVPVVDDFYNWGADQPQIGYIPNTRQIMVSKGAGSSVTGDAYLFDLTTQSWTFLDTALQDSEKHSNFFIDGNSDLCYVDDSGDVRKWSPTPVVSTISVITKDIDFGQPSVRKKVYKVYMSYKGTGNGSITVQYSINGDTDTLSPFYRTGSDGLSDKTNSDTTPLYSNVGTDDWVLAELRPVTSIKNCYSIQLHIGGSTGADFEINDISVVYRLKNIR
tara:strand:- start:465 stop:3095 length:2631 start_codon:yes stop_codon:yes gene_type:complete